MKFIAHTMTSIGGISLFPIVSFVIFFSFFLGLLIWVSRIDKKYINHLENLPLKEDE